MAGALQVYYIFAYVKRPLPCLIHEQYFQLLSDSFAFRPLSKIFFLLNGKLGFGTACSNAKESSIFKGSTGLSRHC